jgi:hypothetical protein
VTGKLTASLSLTASGNDFGEVIFAYPDIAEIPFPPVLNVVENYRGIQPYEVTAPAAAVTGVVYSVNQQLPISLSWSPRGFASYYMLQVDTDPGFANPVVDVSYQMDAFYVWSNAAPATTYYYRVKTSNDSGVSSWSSGSFQTAAPFLQVTLPKGGEAWRRGLPNFITWNNNLAESVRIDLYKGGSPVANITTNAPFKGAFKWSVSPSLTPGSDYTIQITSVADSGLSSTSAHPFSIVDPPAVTPGSVVILPDGNVQFSITCPGAVTTTVLGSTNLLKWQVLQSVPTTAGAGSFLDNAATNNSFRFYRLSVP